MKSRTQQSMDPVELSLFAKRIEAICEEMGGSLKASAFSPNIRDRLDYSCALFDASGALIGQSAAIPVHLGSMAFAMQAVLGDAGEAAEAGGQLVFNDPYRRCVPDVTVVSPIRHAGRLVGFAANRAHHADIGSESPGSMPISRRLEEEGLVIAPTWIHPKGQAMDRLLGRLSHGGGAARGDFIAQFSANLTGARRLEEWIRTAGVDRFQSGCDALNEYGEGLARSTIAEIPDGRYHFEDCLDDDGCGNREIGIRLELEVAGEQLRCDFSASHDQVAGNVNCPRPVVAAAVFFVLRCLMPPYTPNCAGCLRPIDIVTRPGSLLDPEPGAAVAAGNVETSSRIVDVMCGALAQAIPDAIPAAAQGTMNNVAMGASGEQPWHYYETLAGGYGASAAAAGASAVHSHMTNTLNTPIEVAEWNYPMRIETYALRRGSGGSGRRTGGDGLIRSYRLLAPASVTLITERRTTRPWGRDGGMDGSTGRNLLNGEPVGAKVQLDLEAGDLLTIETPGGGGFG